MGITLKKSQFLFLLGVYLFSQALFGNAGSQPNGTFLPVQKIYTIEQGFDTNDATEVAVQGYLPNSCFILGKGTAQIDEVNKTILVSVVGYKRNSPICLEVITPYLEVIQVGPLKKGNYTVRSASNWDISGGLRIDASPSDQVDDHLYAPVDTVYVDLEGEHLNSEGSNQELHLKGTYPHMLTGCMRISDVEVYQTENNVLVVLPKSEIVGLENTEECLAKDVDAYNRFHVVHKMEAPVEEKGLVHVRTLNGRALNKLFDFSLRN